MSELILKYLDQNVKPRKYQENIAKNIIKFGSTLVVLPTGLGKTLIPFIVFDQILQEKANAKMLFLAPTKPLVEQHFTNSKKIFNTINATLITGTTSKKKRKELIENNQIIFATPQTIENMLNEINNEFDIIVFDEAHRGVGKYAYVSIAQHFKNAVKIGLTASPGTTKSEVKEIMKNLDMNNLEVRNEYDSDVAPYVNPIKIHWIKVSLPEPLKQIHNLFKQFLEKQREVLIKLGYPLRKNYLHRELLNLNKKIISDLDNKTKSEAFQAASTLAAMMKIEHALVLLETQGINALKEYVEKIEEEGKQKKGSKAAKKIINSEEFKKAKYIVDSLNLLDIEHPKIKKLIETILKELNNNPEQKIIVFNTYRDSVQNLEKILNENPLISAKRFVGQATKGNDKGLKQKEQKQIIEDFKSGKYNVLLATSVAEEGLDIPQVDTVIFYEPIPSDIRTVQRRGRTGRFKEGKVYVLITEGTRDEAFYWASLAKEKKMKKALYSLAKKESISEKINKIINKTEKKEEKPKVFKQRLITEILDEYAKKIEEKKEEDKIRIIVDTRERNSMVFDELKKRDDCEIIVKQLEIGDYQVGEEAIIERKSVNDLISSIIDGRLFTQATKLSVFEKPLIIIEGDIDNALEGRLIKHNQIYGAILSIMFNHKIPVMMSKDAYETADIVFYFAKREQTKGQKPISLRKIKKEDNLKEIQQFIVEGLPFIGPTLAIRLLKKFGSVKKIFNATPKQLEKIEGIGEKKAEKIYKAINERYKDE